VATMTLRKRLPVPIKRFGRQLISVYKRSINPVKLKSLKYQENVRVHVGCGDERKEGFINIDVRATAATDYVLDLNELECFQSGSVTCFYSHAFFEHLYRNERNIHLKNVYSALPPQGVCCYIGLPYFPNIARYYLEKTPGIVGEWFDLFNVYRYTHGDPEHAKGWWLIQLHKSLFDEYELSELLTSSGFGSYILFNYCCIGEEMWHVNIGFYASKGKRNLNELKRECMTFLDETASNKVLLHTIRFLDFAV
jgi:predicted SAM-dependent methyltransferase